MSDFAGVAQVAEHLICNQDVGGSIPFTSSTSQTKGDTMDAEKARNVSGDWFSDLVEQQGGIENMRGLLNEIFSFPVDDLVSYARGLVADDETFIRVIGAAVVGLGIGIDVFNGNAVLLVVGDRVESKGS